MKLSVILGFHLLLLCAAGEAQPGPLRLTGKIINPGQYAEIKNSPYLFPDFQPAILVPLSGDPIGGVKVNFNGYTQLFELEKDSIRVEMEIGLLIGVQLEASDRLCGHAAFVKMLNPRLINKYPLVLYQGRKYKLIKDFRVTLVENKVETPGKTIRFKTFNPISNYYLAEGKTLQPISLDRGAILRRFQDVAAEGIADSLQLDLDTEPGLCALLAHLEQK